MSAKAWDGTIEAPIGGRSGKPRTTGWTMVLDKGLGLGETADWLALAGDYVDVLKLTFGTSAFYPPKMLRRKALLVRRAGVHIMPGGTLAEIALLQRKWESFLDRAGDLGFDALEISDGTIEIPASLRQEAIRSARERGFLVIAEIGKKHPDDEQDLEFQIEQALADLVAGASKVIVEGRESGLGVGIYGAGGEIRRDRLEVLAGRLPLENVIWEAPLKKQQQELILAFGADVGLGNIPPGDVLALEALRIGLRGDTLRAAIARDGKLNRK